MIRFSIKRKLDKTPRDGEEESAHYELVVKFIDVDEKRVQTAIESMFEHLQTCSGESTRGFYKYYRNVTSSEMVQYVTKNRCVVVSPDHTPGPNSVGIERFVEFVNELGRELSLAVERTRRRI